MPDRLFGTDGVRGVANTELTAKLAFDLGCAAVEFLGKKLVIGKDTRRSGDMLEASLVAGITSRGGDAFLAGVVPTPAVALITSKGDYDGGIVISASHNPPEYNGIKFFSAKGFKLPDSLEDQMQDFIEQGCPEREQISGSAVGKMHIIDDAEEVYIRNAVESLGNQGIDLGGLMIAVDCGHGASGVTTPEALARLGAEVVAINTDYTGDDINVGCGSTNLEQIRDLVIESGADLGLAHDGDADRLQAIDELGNYVDGDQIEAICAVDLKSRGLLPKDTIVSTVMCNLGLRKSMAREGINVITSAVGDRYVLEAMLNNGAALGGEQSGHTIFLQHNTTGDGLITALNLLAALRHSGKSLSELSQVMDKYPQLLINVPVSDKNIFKTSELVKNTIEAVESQLGDQGSVLVRASGTEKLIRVMVEAKDMDIAQSSAQRIADAISIADGAEKID